MKLHNASFKIAGEVTELNFKRGKFSIKIRNKILSSFSDLERKAEYLEEGTTTCKECVS